VPRVDVADRKKTTVAREEVKTRRVEKLETVEPRDAGK